MKKFISIFFLSLLIFAIATLPLPAQAEDNLYEQTEKEVTEIADNCTPKQNFFSTPSTPDIISVRNIINDCLESRLKKEIQSVFRPQEQKKVWQKVQAVKKAVFSYNQFRNNPHIYNNMPLQGNLELAAQTTGTWTIILKQLLTDTIFVLKMNTTSQGIKK